MAHEPLQRSLDDVLETQAYHFLSEIIPGKRIDYDTILDNKEIYEAIATLTGIKSRVTLLRKYEGLSMGEFLEKYITKNL